MSSPLSNPSSLSAEPLLHLQCKNMVLGQLRPWQVHSHDLLEQFYLSERQDFVPPLLKKLAFFDIDLSLESIQSEQTPRFLNPPKVEGRLLQELKNHHHLHDEFKLLEVGSQTGHFTQLLAHWVKSVVACEWDLGLIEHLKENLAHHPHHFKIQIKSASFNEVMSKSSLTSIKPDGVIIHPPITEVLPQWFDFLADDAFILCFVGQSAPHQCVLAKKSPLKEGGKVKFTHLFEFTQRNQSIITLDKGFDF